MIRYTAWELLNPKGTQILLILQRFFKQVVLSKLVLFTDPLDFSASICSPLNLSILDTFGASRAISQL